MLTFGYGSNMCYGRIRFRLPHVQHIAVASLSGYSFRFHKRSRDGSAKADALRTNDAGDVVWGVIFEVSVSEKKALDQAEGLGHGYSEAQVVASDLAGKQYDTSIYVAE